MNIIVVAGLSNFKLNTKLYGLYKNCKIDKIFLIRKVPIYPIKSKKIININPQYSFFKLPVTFELWKLFKFIKIIAQQEISLIYVIQLIPHSFLPYIFSLIFNKKLIMSVIGSDIHIHFHKPILNFILKRIICQADIITHLGNKSRQTLIDSGLPKEKSILFLEYIEPTKFTPDSETIIQWDLIYVGDLIPVKDLSYLIKAIALASKDVPNIKLCIVGDGNDLSKLNALVKHYSLEKQVDFIGKADNVEYYLNRSRAFIMTSISEGLPAAALEAMFCGLPVILPNIGDIPSFFKDNVNANIFEKKNIKELTRYIIELNSDIKLYTKLKQGAFESREQYINDWGKEKQAHKWTEIFNQI